MPRPTLLVAEPEPSQALSVRKLVLETAKYNVLTAHSSREALDLFHLFPNVSMAVLVGDEEIDCDAIAKHIRGATDKIPIVFLTARIGGKCNYAQVPKGGRLAGYISVYAATRTLRMWGCKSGQVLLQPGDCRCSGGSLSLSPQAGYAPG
jgi:CheY-like chemotaxis protein